jgi:hypothetical protein
MTEQQDSAAIPEHRSSLNEQQRQAVFAQAEHVVDTPDPIVIRIDDWEEDPPEPVKYICGDNEIDFLVVYAKIKSLTHHPGRGRLEIHQETRKHLTSLYPSSHAHPKQNCI